MASDPLVVVYDACVLYPFHLRNLLVQFAVDGLVAARWQMPSMTSGFEVWLDQDRVLVVQLPDFEPGRKDRIPAILIGSGREFRHVVDRAVGLDPLELAEIFDRMTAIAGDAADTDEEQAPLAVLQSIGLRGLSLDGSE